MQAIFTILGDSSPSIFYYFNQSDLAGKTIVVLLGIFSLVAWTVMIGKHIEIKRFKLQNLALENKFFKKNNLQQVDLETAKGPYANLIAKAYEITEYIDTEKANLVEHVSSAVQREVAKQSAAYETKMMMLGSIVSGAPFLGLLGTVWGVMDAFGSMTVQGTSSLQNLAPGVSGALLTTVAGLLVAIPSVFGYNYLLSSIKQMIVDLENFASALIDRVEIEWK